MEGSTMVGRVVSGTCIKVPGKIINSTKWEGMISRKRRSGTLWAHRSMMTWRVTKIAPKTRKNTKNTLLIGRMKTPLVGFLTPQPQPR